MEDRIDLAEGLDPSIDNYPLISVRIAAYNHDQYVEEALDSVAHETYPNLEIVITDDCSTDETAKIIDNWIDRNPSIKVDFVKNKKNQGISRTLNQTIERCKGEYIISLASDDFLLKDGILKRYKYLCRNPSRLAVFADCIVVDKNSKLTSDSGLTKFHKATIKEFKTPKGIRKEFIMNWSVPGPVLMMHRSVPDIVGPYDERLALEDWDFYLRMATRNLIGFINEKVSAYRVHGKNTCMVPETKVIRLVSRKETLIKNMSSFNLFDRMRAIRKIKKLEKKIQKATLTRDEPDGH